MISAVDSGIMSTYVFDPAYPPDPNSTIPANALFGRMAPHFLTETNEMSPYGQSFFSAMLTGANIYQWQPAIDVLADMVAIMDMGHMPFTIDDLMPMMDQLVNPDAPAPRNIYDNTDCAADVTACLMPIDCVAEGGYWYDNTCNVLQPVQTAHIEGSLFYSEREDIGPFTVDNDGDFTVLLSGTGDIDLYVRRNARANDFSYDCKSDNPATSEESCVLYGAAEYWISLYGDWDAQTTYTLDVSNDPNINGPPDGTGGNGTGCAIDLPTCSTPKLCADAGGYWYADVCNIIPPVQIADFSEQLVPGDYMDFGPFTVENEGNLLVEMTGTGDADLYVRKSSLGSTSDVKATPVNYDCKSTTAMTTIESCELTGEGIYWIYVRSNGPGTAEFDLNISNDPINIDLNIAPSIFENRVSEDGNGGYLIEIFGEGFTGSSILISEVQTYSQTLRWGDYEYYGPFDAANGNFTARLTGTGDVDLYVDDEERPFPRASRNECNSYSSDSNELCEIAEVGQYWITVDAFDDSTYTLTVDYPKPTATVYIINGNYAILLTDTAPEGDIRIEGADGQSTSLAIPENIEPLEFNDDDDDGLHNALETLLGTDLQNSDSDGDGISDLDEVTVDGDRTSYAPGVDTDPLFNDNDADGDGLNNDVDPLPDTFNYNDGDLAPLGAPDGKINAADYLIATRIQLGQVAAGEVQMAHGDVYPPGTPDGVINIQDVILIQKLVMGN